MTASAVIAVPSTVAAGSLMRSGGKSCCVHAMGPQLLHLFHKMEWVLTRDLLALMTAAPETKAMLKNIGWRFGTHSAVRAVSWKRSVGREPAREDLAKLRELRGREGGKGRGLGKW